MKQIIISVIIIAISVIVWIHWGSFSNDLGTLIIALADVFALTVVADNSPKKSEEKVKE